MTIGYLKRAALVLLAVMAMALWGACSDDEGDNGTGPSSSQLTGTWDMTEFSYTSVADPTVTENLLQSQGLSVTLTFGNNGSYTVTTTIMGQSFTTSGTFNENDGEISDPDPDTTVDLSGNTLTVTIVNESWDFGNGPEAATLRQVYQKR